MPRRKLYTTKAERQEANRLNSSLSRNSTAILEYKRAKRDSDIISAQKQRTIKRQKFTRQSRLETPKEIAKPTAASSAMKKAPDFDPVAIARRELEQRMANLKKKFIAFMDSKGGEPRYFEGICRQALTWMAQLKHRTTISPIPTSPIIDAKCLFDQYLLEYEPLENEYFYATRDCTGPKWDEKRDDFTIFKVLVGKKRALLEDMQLGVDQGDLGRLHSCLELKYQTYYSSIRTATLHYAH
ncbi:hypothetical protein PQX77_021147 [Marasmius sp. AFHP31]|nr:hypothetical protein PQX77_021147 [Marasmius sp. AFHP31]